MSGTSRVLLSFEESKKELKPTRESGASRARGIREESKKELKPSLYAYKPSVGLPRRI